MIVGRPAPTGFGPPVVSFTSGAEGLLSSLRMQVLHRRSVLGTPLGLHPERGFGVGGVSVWIAVSLGSRV